MAEVQYQDFLSVLTDALRDERADVEPFFTQYAVPHSEADPLVALIRRLRQTFMPVKPSRRFVNRLRADLRGTPQVNMINRIRYLPAQVHIAAGVALLAGFFMLITRRRVALAPRPKPQEAPVA
ncbi:MAG: hypothetical protein U0694_18485 [Anaerolineae bacterium]